MPHHARHFVPLKTFRHGRFSKLVAASDRLKTNHVAVIMISSILLRRAVIRPPLFGERHRPIRVSPRHGSQVAEAWFQTPIRASRCNRLRVSADISSQVAEASNSDPGRIPFKASASTFSAQAPARPPHGRRTGSLMNAPATKAKRNAMPLQLYSGQLLVGEIEDHGRGRVIAFRLDRRRRIKVGTYPTRRDAMRALARPAEESDPRSSPTAPVPTWGPPP